MGNKILVPSLVDSCTFSVLVAQSCLTLFHPMDCGSPGSSVHGDSPGKDTAWSGLPFSKELQTLLQTLCPSPGFAKAGFPPQFAVSLAASEGQA